VTVADPVASEHSRSQLRAVQCAIARHTNAPAVIAPESVRRLTLEYRQHPCSMSPVQHHRRQCAQHRPLKLYLQIVGRMTIDLPDRRVTVSAINSVQGIGIEVREVRAMDTAIVVREDNVTTAVEAPAWGIAKDSGLINVMQAKLLSAKRLSKNVR
jgi:hypothetical protein